jgi:hypothetical protein
MATQSVFDPVQTKFSRIGISSRESGHGIGLRFTTRFFLVHDLPSFPSLLSWPRFVAGRVTDEFHVCLERRGALGFERRQFGSHNSSIAGSLDPDADGIPLHAKDRDRDLVSDANLFLKSS